MTNKSNILKVMFLVLTFLNFIISGCNDRDVNAGLINTSSENANSPQSLANHADNIVTVYLLIDNSEQLKAYVDDLSRVDRVNFNRVIFAFIRPRLLNYTSGDLANTGILGYYRSGDGNGDIAFQKLKDAIAISHTKNLQVFLSVGGWNYSCNYAEYKDECGESNLEYDWFPDPNDPADAQIAITSYNNIVQLANDLGVDGIDIDYEEFWHADKYAIKWVGNSWDSSNAKQIQIAGGPTYSNLVKFESGGAATTTGPEIIPVTVAKLDAVLNKLEKNANAAELIFTTTASPTGAVPTMTYTSSDSDLTIKDTPGEIREFGSLKGLWYNLAYSGTNQLNKLDSLGVMTYDLCDYIESDCNSASVPNLIDSVNDYINEYNYWLKNPEQSNPMLTIDPDSDRVAFEPAKYNVKAKIQFGFGINDPMDVKGGNKLQLTKSLVSKILQKEAQKVHGVIIWQMYSAPDRSLNDYATAKNTIAQSCKAFLNNDSNYDCNADFPASAGQ